MARKAKPVKVHCNLYRGVWRIYWRQDGKKKMLYPGTSDENVAKIKASQLQIYLLGEGPIPEWAAEKLQKKVDRLDVKQDNVLLQAFNESIKGELSESWYKCVKSYVGRFATFCHERNVALCAANSSEVQTFLKELMSKGSKKRPTVGKSRGTRNRYRSAIKDFYDWAVLQRHVVENPVKGVKVLNEKKRRRIRFLSPKERNRVIIIAERILQLPDYLAIWIACYSGMRRGEIKRLKWPDVWARKHKIRVWETKNRERGQVDRDEDQPRWVDLSETLEKKLKSIYESLPKSKRKGYVIRAWNEDFDKKNWEDSSAQNLELIRRYISGIREHKRIDARDINYNPFRHTFGTHLALYCDAQVDYICAQLGNTSEVARRHYVDLCGASGGAPANKLR